MSAQLQAVEGATEIAAVMRELGSRARQAARVLALAPTQQKDDALAAMADEIRARKADERARGRRNAERRSIGLSAPRGGRTAPAMGTHERPRSYQPLA